MPVRPTESLQTFLYHIIDYAGLFPPASLPLSEAFKNYLNYLQSPYSWMLSKFICPANLLHELDEFMKDLQFQRVSFSVLGSRSKASEQFLESLDVDLKSIADFMNNNNRKVQIETIELRLPESILKGSNSVSEFFKILSGKIHNSIPYIRNLFCEIPFLAEWEAYLDNTLKNISYISSKSLEIGFKLRTGGTDASSFPTSEQIAHVIKLCRDNNIKLKCTAGLHHPIRHFSTEVKTKMHGFLNVFAAGILAYVQNISKEKITEILDDEDSKDYSFNEDTFSWKEISVSVEEIAEARKNFIVSFGSCSFDEPVNDLKTISFL